MLRVGVPLLRNNAPTHAAQVAVAQSDNRSFELLRHPSYLPDVAPSGLVLFSKS